MSDKIGPEDWQKKEKQVFWGEIAPTEHILQIYEDDKEFIDVLEGFVGGGLKAGESVIIIATTSHLKALNKRLKEQFDLFSLTLRDQYIPLNAEEVLAQFMIDGWPDENLFYHLLTNLLLRARKRGARVRAFGEMVAILWAQGYSGATVRLEHLWSHYCKAEAFSLFCAYPRTGFTKDANSSLDDICNCHSKFIAGLDDTSSTVFFRETSEEQVR